MTGRTLVTGATGALGQMFLPRLAAAGYQVACFVREKGNLSPHERIAQLIGKHNFSVIRGDIREPLCGVSQTDLAQWKGRVDSIMHCAASVSFDDKEAARSVNIDGTRNMLQLADRLGVKDFRYVSTAYVAGDAERLREDDLDVGQSHRNAYEKSKFAAEHLVRAWAGIDKRFTVYRPSILIGCASGMTPTFDGYYQWPRMVDYAADTLRKKDRLPQGVTLRGTLGNKLTPIVEAPFCFVGSRYSTLNLIFIDWVADTMVQLGTAPPGTYHLVHNKPPTVRSVMNATLAYFKLRANVVDTQEEKERLIKSQPRSIALLQERIDEVHRNFLPYVTHEAQFDMQRTRAALKDAFQEPVEITGQILQALLAYAVIVNWGRDKWTLAPEEPIPAAIYV